MEATAQKLVVRTSILQDLTVRASKGSSCIESLPLTCLMEIKLENDVLSLTTTDGPNYITVKETGITGSPFYIVVETKLFSQLVSKITTQEITLETDGNSLKVIGNGTYNIALRLENGEPIRFPSIEFDYSVNKVHISPEQLRSILTNNKASIATTKEDPILICYYLDDQKVLTTDGYKCCVNNIKAFESPVCLEQKIMDLTSFVVDDNGVDIQLDRGKVCFSSSKGTLVGPRVEEQDAMTYPVQDVLETANTQKYSSSCRLNRNALIDTLERLSLFSSDYDRNAVYLTFETDGVTVSNKKSGSNEFLRYIDTPTPAPTQDISVAMDIGMFKPILQTGTKDSVELRYNPNIDENPTMIVNVNDTVQAITILDEGEIY